MLGFGLFNLMFPIVFVLVIGMFVYAFASTLATWNKNNNSPRLTVDAVVVAKREDISHHHHANGGDISGAHGFHTSTSTTYYATFEVESGDRMELTVSGMEYGKLANGDRGRLSFQGTRYLGFERIF